MYIYKQKHNKNSNDPDPPRLNGQKWQSTFPTFSTSFLITKHIFKPHIYSCSHMFAVRSTHTCVLTTYKNETFLTHPLPMWYTRVEVTYEF